MAKEAFQVIAEHSVAVDRLPEKANILDCGCRGFLFTQAMRELGHHVVPIDIDHLNESQAYYQCAISDFDGKVGVFHSSDPQATRIDHLAIRETVPCYTLKSLTDQFIPKGKMWDLIKIDIEGAEYEVIMSMENPYAKQLSVEFHCHTGQITPAKMRQMENKLRNLGYEFVSHAQSQQHGAGWNYWDSLFIL
jgi:hypothetical protein